MRVVETEAVVFLPSSAEGLPVMAEGGLFLPERT